MSHTNTYILAVDGSHWVRLDDYRKLEQQLAEARMALAELVPYLSWYGDVGRLRTKHAKAIRAANQAVLSKDLASELLPPEAPNKEPT